MKETAIVVPIYKNELNPFEEISLRQLRRVLFEHPIVIIKPNTLTLKNGCFNFEFDIKNFDDHFFQSTATYTELMLNIDFYKEFKRYENILIYQTDAFVFSDRLKEFEDLDRDYIGAPSPKYYWGYLINQVGNGGFSLRKVKSCMKLLEHKKEILNKAKQELSSDFYSQLIENEDQFFAYASQDDRYGFCSANIDEAERFSVEFNINDAYGRVRSRLPFGTHRWYKENFDFWWPIIKSFGYSASERSIKKYTEKGSVYEKNVLYDCVDKQVRVAEIKNIVNEMLPSDCLYFLRGAGDLGKKCLKLMKCCGYNVKGVIDKDANIDFDGIDVYRIDSFDFSHSGGTIIISSIKYEYEIQRELVECGMQNGVDYYIWSEIEFNLIKRLSIQIT